MQWISNKLSFPEEKLYQSLKSKLFPSRVHQVIRRGHHVTLYVYHVTGHTVHYGYTYMYIFCVFFYRYYMNKTGLIRIFNVSKFVWQFFYIYATHVSPRSKSAIPGVLVIFSSCLLVLFLNCESMYTFSLNSSKPNVSDLHNVCSKSTANNFERHFEVVRSTFYLILNIQLYRSEDI